MAVLLSFAIKGGIRQEKEIKFMRIVKKRHKTIIILGLYYCVYRKKTKIIYRQNFRICKIAINVAGY